MSDELVDCLEEGKISNLNRQKQINLANGYAKTVSENWTLRYIFLVELILKYLISNIRIGVDAHADYKSIITQLKDIFPVSFQAADIGLKKKLGIRSFCLISDAAYMYNYLLFIIEKETDFWYLHHIVSNFRIAIICLDQKIQSAIQEQDICTYMKFIWIKSDDVDISKTISDELHSVQQHFSNKNKLDRMHDTFNLTEQQQNNKLVKVADIQQYIAQQNKSYILNFYFTLLGLSPMCAWAFSNRFGSVRGLLEWYELFSNDEKPHAIYRLGQICSNENWMSGFDQVKLNKFQQMILERSSEANQIFQEGFRPTRELSEKVYKEFGGSI